MSESVVVREYVAALESDNVSAPMAAITALVQVLRASEATTLMALVRDELGGSCAALRAWIREQGTSGVGVTVPVDAALDVFTKYITRSGAESDAERDFADLRATLVKRGEVFAERLAHSRERVAAFGWKFMAEGATVLVHGHSRAVVGLLALAVRRGRNIEVVVTEGRPGGTGKHMAAKLAALGVPTRLVVDAAIGVVMEEVDVVLCGAEGLMENGGVLNCLGTFPVALMAHAHRKPVYVAAESFKFLRKFPLSQREVASYDSRAPERRAADAELALGPVPEGCGVLDCAASDYTPPEYITAIFTDLGVSSTSAISDELIKLFQ